MRLIGLDIAYAKSIQIAMLTSRGRLLTLVKVEPDMSFIETARRVREVILPMYDSLVVFESPGLYNNRTTGLKLIRLATMIEVFVAEAGFPVVQIDPRRWQKYVLGKIKRGESKKMSIEKATEIFGAKIAHPLNKDEADALNIAWFASKNSKQLLNEYKGIQ